MKRLLFLLIMVIAGHNMLCPYDVTLMAQEAVSYGHGGAKYKITSDTTGINKDIGRLYFYTSDSKFYVGDGTYLDAFTPSTIANDSLGLRELTVSDSAYIDTCVSSQSYIKANNGNASQTMLELVNTDEQSSGEVGQNAQIKFFTQSTSDNGTSFSDALMGMIRAGKSNDYFNASGTADNDGFILFQVPSAGVPRDVLKLDYYRTALAQGTDYIYWDGTAFYASDSTYDLGKTGNRYRNAYIANLNVNSSNANVTKIDTVCTAGGTPRWIKITVGGVVFWAVSDTSITAN